MKYGIFRDENGFSERANIIVDEKQKVVFVRITRGAFGAGYRGIFAFLAGPDEFFFRVPDIMCDDHPTPDGRPAGGSIIGESREPGNLPRRASERP